MLQRCNAIIITYPHGFGCGDLNFNIMNIKEISIGAIQNGRKYTTECVITTNHIDGNTLDKIFVCETYSTRYFKTCSITKSEDCFCEIGYWNQLLKKRSLEEIEYLLLGKELVEATDEQDERAKEESSWC